MYKNGYFHKHFIQIFIVTSLFEYFDPNVQIYAAQLNRWNKEQN